MKLKTFLLPIVAAVLSAILFVPAFAEGEWEVETRQKSALDDRKMVTAASSGFVKPHIPPAFPYEDLAAKLVYSCEVWAVNAWGSPTEPRWIGGNFRIIFNKRANLDGYIEEDISGNFDKRIDARVKFGKGKTTSWVLKDDFVYGASFYRQDSTQGELFGFSYDSFADKVKSAPNGDLIIGIHWAGSGESLFTFAITDEMKSAIVDVETKCGKSAKKESAPKDQRKHRESRGGNK